MADFVKKTVMGYRETEKGYQDPECSHVILEKEEYDSLKKELYEKDQVAKEKIRNAEKDFWEKERTTNFIAAREKSELKQRISELEEELAAAQQQAEYQKSLNINLLRISRERANAKRDLRPRREHSGYVVKRSTEKEYRFSYGGRWYTLMLWETVIETPYTVDHSSEDAAELIEELFVGKQTDREWIISDLGITRRYLSLKAFHEEWAARKAPEDNTSIEQRLSANYKSGFWEIQLLHTKPLDVVPWHWREAAK